MFTRELGKTGIEVDITATSTANHVADAIRTAVNGVGGGSVFSAAGTSPAVVITNLVGGSVSDITDGNVGGSFSVATNTQGVDSAILISSLFPSPIYFLAELVISFFGAVAATSIMVLVSTRVNNLREATQVGGVVMLPLIGIVYSQMAGFIIPENALPGQIFEITAIVITIVFMFVAIGAFYLAKRTFNREKLIAKL